MIGEKIKQLRRKCSMTQRELAAFIGLSLHNGRITIRRLERDCLNRPPSLLLQTALKLFFGNIELKKSIDMETTSYGISKALSENGFHEKADYAYERDEEYKGLWSIDYELKMWGDYDEEKYYMSYSLDEIIKHFDSRLSIEIKGGGRIVIMRDISNSLNDVQIRRDEESLVDAVAELLLFLEYNVNMR